jgi:membrane associated rhomboid family serine protease
MSDFDEIRSYFRTNRMPVTLGILVLAVALYVIEWLFRPHLFTYLLYPVGTPGQPWGAITYPFAQTGGGNDVITLIFECWWLWMVGSMVERDMQSFRFGAFWVAMTVLPALLMTIVAALMHLSGMPLMGLELPLAAVTVAWATRHPEELVRLMMVIPIKAKWIGWLTVVVVVFTYGAGLPVLGVAAALPLAATWALVSGRLPFVTYLPNRGKEGRLRGIGYTPFDRAPTTYFEDVRKREQERMEKERLRKLFEKSLIDEPKDDRDAGSDH